jgi:hypothetical protein
MGLCKFPMSLDQHAGDAPLPPFPSQTMRMQGSTASMLSIFELFPLRYATLATTITFDCLRSLFTKPLTLLLPTNMAFASPLRTTDPKRLPRPLPRAKAPGPFDTVQTYKRYVKDSNVSHCPPRRRLGSLTIKTIDVHANCCALVSIRSD